jgi:hypothetical protein
MIPVDPAGARRLLRAPREHGAVLIEPPLSQVAALLAANVRLCQPGGAMLAGLPLDQLARQARAELLDAAWRYTSSYRDIPRLAPQAPLLMAGHQPQLFHPGVWFKNFMLGRLAERHGAAAVNLIIDNDTLRSASLRVPGGSIDAPTWRAVPLDAPGPEIPFEERAILDRATFAAFGERAAREIAPLVPQPLVEQLWPLVVEQSRPTNNLGQCLAQGRHRLEGQWGLQTLELPQSQLCQLPAFYRFVAHLLAAAPRLRDVYNAAVAEYRRANHIRSASHPVPDLAAEGDWIETPLWIWRGDDPRRRRLFVRRVGDRVWLADRQHEDLPLPSPVDDSLRTAEALATLARRGIKLRTRALITTLWARLALSDLFLHGIGGAKYDQVTDVLFARFFGLAPPGYMTVTATLQLPIERPAVSTGDLRAIDRELRELDFHPERFLDGTVSAGASASQWSLPEGLLRPGEGADEMLERLRQEKAAWIATPSTRDTARQRCRAIRSVNAALQPWVEARRQALLAERERLAARLSAAAVLGSREHSFCLHPEASLRNFLLEFPLDKP